MNIKRMSEKKPPASRSGPELHIRDERVNPVAGIVADHTRPWLVMLGTRALSRHPNNRAARDAMSRRRRGLPSGADTTKTQIQQERRTWPAIAQSSRSLG